MKDKEIVITLLAMFPLYISVQNGPKSLLKIAIFASFEIVVSLQFSVILSFGFMYIHNWL